MGSCYNTGSAIQDVNWFELIMQAFCIHFHYSRFLLAQCPGYLKRGSLKKLRIIIRPGCYLFFPIKENVDKWLSWLKVSISDITLATQTPVVSRAMSASTNKEFASAMFRPCIFCWADLLCLVDVLCSWSNWRAIFVAIKMLPNDIRWRFWPAP